MKIRLVPIAITSPKTTLDDLFTYAETRTSLFQFGDYERLIRIVIDKTHIKGLLVTIKDDRRFMQIERSTLEVSAREIEAGTNIVDFNFFVLNRESGRGLYQHYHHSCGSNQFFGLLRQLCSDYLVSRDPDPARPTRRTHLDGEILMVEDTFDRLLDELDRVDSLHLSVGVLSDSSNAMRPLTNYVRKTSVRFAFKPDLKTLAGLKRSIKKAINHMKPSRGRVEGTEDGLKRIINIDFNPHVFQEYEFDEIAPKALRLKLENFSSMRFLNTMKKHVDDNPAMFKMRLRN